MKKILVGAVALTIIAVAGIFYSCQKEVNNEVITTDQSIQNLKTTVKVEMSWEEWGRAAKGCKGAGLCNFKATITISRDANPDAHTAILYTDRSYGENDKVVNMYANILIDEKYVFDADGTSFYIDEDLVAYDEDGYKYVIPKGVYPLHAEFGKMGGYTIPVIRIKE
jgi:hypothetical protein